MAKPSHQAPSGVVASLQGRAQVIRQGQEAAEPGKISESDSAAFTIAPSLYLPIFNAGRNRANLQVAEASQKIAVAQYEGSIQSAFREVSDTLVNRQALKDQLDAQSRQLEAEQVRYKLSDLRYTNGVASYLDLLDAQRSLFALEQSGQLDAMLSV